MLLTARQAQAQYIYSMFEQSGMAGQPALTGMRHPNMFRSYQLDYLQRNYSFGQEGPQIIGRYIGGEYHHQVGRVLWRKDEDVSGRDSSRFILHGLAWGAGLYHETEKTENKSLHYMGDYASFSVNTSIWKRWDIGFGIQAGRFATIKKEVIDLNGGLILSYNGALNAGKDALWMRPGRFDNYLAVSIYHPGQPFSPNADSSSISSKRIHVSGKLRFQLTKQLDVQPVFNAIYNGRLLYDAGAWLSYGTDDRSDNNIRLGMQYQSTRHLSIMAASLMIMDQIPDLDLHFAYNIPMGGTERLGYYRPGFEFGISMGVLGGKIIVCRNRVPVPPSLLAMNGGQRK